MISKKCKRCGKKITGYSESHVDYMLSQHRLGKKCIKIKLDMRYSK